MSIKIENVEVLGFEAAIRGMRNPHNSWSKSDTNYSCTKRHYLDREFTEFIATPDIGEADLTLMRKLAKGGSTHAKYRRMITVYMDITAPLYWWKEFDTYKVGTVANSCSTMHKIHTRELKLDDFSHEHLNLDSREMLEKLIKGLNEYRYDYLVTNDKDCWWQIIQLLPSSYNQKRTVQMNYEVLVGIYRDRKNHKLDEWVALCECIEKLPYSEIITGEVNNEQR